MKKSALTCCCLLICLAFAVPANALILFSDDFETAWTGDYAPSWVNADYRHGDPPVGKMMQQTTTSHSGSYGLQLTAESAEDWMFWAAVEVESLPHAAMAKEYNPYVSAWYYDELGDTKAGQIYAVPDWVNGYTGENYDEDWTDVQFGARNSVTDNYYHVACGENMLGWQDTGVVRTNDWHQLKFQLSSSDGYIHYFLDGTEVGTSYRNDYTNLGTAIGLYTMFDVPLSAWGENKPFTLWDDFEVGSSAPVPATLWLLGPGLIGLVGLRRRFSR